MTFNPDFVDNTFGENQIGWGHGKHEFDKLVGSGHVELRLTDCNTDTVMHFVVDFVSEDPDSPSGFSSLGVSGGDRDGSMIIGDPDHILAVGTSLDRNLNGCGYSETVVDSPLTDEDYTPNPDAPDWDFRMTYDIWVDSAAFDGCFGQAYVTSVHASPSKFAEDTQETTPGECPPGWDEPYCPEAVCDTPPEEDYECPQNFTQYTNSEGCEGECVPIPFAGYTDRAACPTGYQLDLDTEGRYCVPISGEVCP
ncbi:MAG: hypothetical protein HRU17_16390 [Polyangiaceae bacterium]|nr:hypothetical protein [Polyangiaceae bacterium]